MLEFNVLSSDTNKKVYSTLIINNFAYSNPLMNILIDTGAYIPTWTKGISLFMKTFPNATFAKTECLSKGFGLSYDVLPVYIIKEYRLTDELLNLLEPEYPNIHNRLNQQKIIRNISVLAQE